MKRVISILLIFLISLSLIGCNTKSKDNNFIESVETFETNLYKLNNLEITTYDSFINNIEDVMYKPRQYFDNKLIFAVDGKEFKGKDIKNLTKEDFDQYRKRLEESMKTVNFDINELETTINISDVYDANKSEWKYVYSKVIREFNDNKNTTDVINKRYTFKKFDGKWKIFAIDESIGFYWDGIEDDRGISKEDILDKMKYHTIDNEPVEYKTSINIVQ